MIAPPAQTIQIDAGALRALRDRNTRLEAQAGWEQRARITAVTFEGQWLSAALLSTEGVGRWDNEQPPDLLTLSLGTYGSHGGTVGNRRYSGGPRRLCYVRLPGEPLRSRLTSPRVQTLLLHLPLASLVEEYNAQGGVQPDLNALIKALPAAENYLLAATERLLHIARSNPSQPPRPCLFLQRSLLSIVASSLREARPGTPAAPDLSASAVHVQEALAYLNDHLSEALTLATISRSCGISSRTLQAAFALHHHCSPMEALLTLRLQRLREQLQQGERSVREACRAAGLSFSGRTAQAYRRLFGEVPSQTLRPARHPDATDLMVDSRTRLGNRG